LSMMHMMKYNQGGLKIGDWIWLFNGSQTSMRDSNKIGIPSGK
jgi:hypothetical protein